MMHPCLLCRSHQTEVAEVVQHDVLARLYRRQFGVILRPREDPWVRRWTCASCGLEFFDPMLEPPEDFYRTLAKTAWYYLPEKWEFEEALGDLEGRERILEVGSGEGFFLRKVRKAYPHAELTGLEPSAPSDPATGARRHSTAIDHAGSLRSMTLEDFVKSHAQTFDAICAFQVLEHTKDPRAFMEAAASRLHPGGVLIVSVPHQAGFLSLTYNNVLNWPPHHYTRWYESTFRSLEKELPLKLLRVTVEPLSSEHRRWYGETRVRAKIYSMMGVRLRSIADRTFATLAVEAMVKIFNAPSWRLRKKKGVPGHTLLAVFKKL